MISLLISANDTGVGKTRVAALLAAYLSPARVQVVKAVETGVAVAETGDAATVAATLGHPANLSVHRILAYQAALAPLDAAAAEGSQFNFEALAAAVLALPVADWRIIEGAGGLAVPLHADGRDWTDFFRLAGVDRCLLVVDNRLGAINQARLTAAYAQAAGLRYGLWLNQLHDVPAAVLRSNESSLRMLGLPLVAKSGPDARRPDILDPAFLQP